MRLLSLKTAALAAATAGALAFTGLGATAASAGTVPGGGHDGGFQPQVFLIHQEDSNPGTVKAFGPIQGRGTDFTLSGTRDLFAFRKGSVYVDHWVTSDSKPKLDFRACTATIYENGTWQIDPPGTGKYARARSKDGQYAAVIVLGFRHKHDGGPGYLAPQGGGGDHKCRIDLDKQPETSVVDVTAWGKVSLGHGHRY